MICMLCKVKLLFNPTKCQLDSFTSMQNTVFYCSLKKILVRITAVFVKNFIFYVYDRLCFNKYVAFFCYCYLAGLQEQSIAYLVYPTTDYRKIAVGS